MICKIDVRSRDPRTKTGWSRTDSDRSVPGPGGPWIPVSSDVCILRVCSPSENLCDESSGEGGNGQWVSEWGSFLRRIQRSSQNVWVSQTFQVERKKLKWLTFLKIMKIREKIILWRIIIFNYYNNKKWIYLYVPYYHHARQERIKNLNQIGVNLIYPWKSGGKFLGSRNWHLYLLITMNVVCLFYATDKTI